MQHQDLQQINKYCFISYVKDSVHCPIKQREIIQDCLNRVSHKKKKKRPFYIMGHEKIPPRDARHISWPENFLESTNHPSLDVVFLFNETSFFTMNEAKEIYKDSGLNVNQTILIIVQELPSNRAISA